MKALWIWIAICAMAVGCGGGAVSGLVANAGADFSVAVGEAPKFDGCASAGSIVNYKWTIVTAPSGMAKDAGKVLREVNASCSFTLESEMGLQEVGEWVIQLEVRDAGGNTATDTVTVTVNP